MHLDIGFAFGETGPIRPLHRHQGTKLGGHADAFGRSEFPLASQPVCGVSLTDCLPRALREAGQVLRFHRVDRITAGVVESVGTFRIKDASEGTVRPAPGVR